MNSRQIILRILTAFDKKPGILDTVINRELWQNPVDHRDRRFVFEIVYGIMRRRLTLDHVVSQFINERKALDTGQVRRILQIGAYQILYMERVPDHASVNESVNLAHLDRRTAPYAGLINAVLRAVIKNRRHFERPSGGADLVQRLSIEFSHPKWLLRRWLDRFGLTKTKLLLSFNNEKPDVFLRRKLRGLSRQQFETEMKNLCDGASGYLNCFYRLRKSVQPDVIDLFKEGWCTVQAPSSGWVVALCDVRKSERMVDVCCAPGGKTAFMSELTGEGGKVFACEIRWNRMQTALDTFGRMKLANVSPLLCDGCFLPFSALFDKVLVDAPCSATGVFHRHPEARWTKTEVDIERLPLLQQRLLESGAAFVAVGGVLVYSTCSLETEENEGVIKTFLDNHPQFILDSPPEAIPGRFISPEGYLKITPFEHSLDGMFGARLKKVS
jgi:16S rRNA (cytosine967-C5)-methyltransferase